MMKRLKRDRFLADKDLNAERGDTLVEVLLAITILSIVAIGSMVVMNRGNALVQGALERTAIRAEINSQSEMLHYVRDHNPALWRNIKGRTVSESNAKNSCLATNGKSFYLNFNDLRNSSAPPTAPSRLATNPDGSLITRSNGRAEAGNGLWIDVLSNTSNPKYIDFYIKACWTPIGSASGPQSNSLTIVRIYDNAD